MIKILNLLFFAGMVVMNYLANALPLNGKNTGQLSDAFPNLFVPAGITFSIWGVIYLLLAVFCIVQFSVGNQDAVTRIGWLFALSCLFNALWIVCWHYEKVPLSVLVMAGLLVTLIFINIHLKNEPSGILKASFGIYLGWICIATIANITALLVHYKWNGSGITPEVWTIVMIVTGTFITIMAMISFRNPFIGISVVWAFAGIILKRQADFRTIVITAAVSALVVGFFIIRSFILKNIQGGL
jgi:hypothetical protein